MKSLRTLLVEDNPAFQRQICDALSNLAQDCETVTFELGKDAISFLFESERNGQSGNSIDLALVDIGLPDMSGIDVIRCIRMRMPDIPILVISVLRSETALLHAIRAGARGYVLKGEAEGHISHSIAEVMRGNYPVSPALARSLFRIAGAPDDSPDHGKFTISNREKDVLTLIARGLSYQEVATQLGISLSTVQTYIRTLYRKLNVHNRQAAVNKGRKVGVILQ